MIPVTHRMLREPSHVESCPRCGGRNLSTPRPEDLGSYEGASAPTPGQGLDARAWGLVECSGCGTILQWEI